MTENQVYQLRITLNGVIVDMYYDSNRRQWIARVNDEATRYTRAKGDAIIDILTRIKKQFA